MNTTQMKFVATGGAPTQTDKLIACLHGANGAWVDLPTLVAFVGGYAIHSRAADARKMGVPVENSVKFDPVTNKRLSWYRLSP
jgi:hypothetical protein